MVKNEKTKEERVIEVINIRKQLMSLGLSNEIEGIQDFYDICRDYVELGHSWSGKIKLPGTKRILEGRLVMRKNLDCSVNLKYNDHV